MEPLPLINKVYSLVTQEERQKAVSHSGSSIDSQVIFAAKNSDSKAKNQKKNHPLCNHCCIFGHTVDKCFKLHGYPLSYKPKSKASFANQVSIAAPVTNVEQISIPVDQYKQLLAMLTSHISQVSTSNATISSAGELGIVHSTHLHPHTLVLMLGF